MSPAIFVVYFLQEKTIGLRTKVAKGQLISKGPFKDPFAPKNEQKYFCISALASKKGRIKKIQDKYMINSIELVF